MPPPSAADPSAQEHTAVLERERPRALSGSGFPTGIPSGILARQNSWHSDRFERAASTQSLWDLHEAHEARRISCCLKPTYTTNPHSVVSDRVVIAMVGLPARGKSYISKAIVRYLNFLGCPAQLFNAGNKRRQEGAAGVQAGFFNASNLDAKAQRERMAMETLDDLLAWLHEVTTLETGCACGILDATNTTKDRRERVRQRVARETPACKLIFLELVCNDPTILNDNYKMKLSNEDYKGKDPEAALRDFKERVRQYEMVYEPVDDATECTPLHTADSGEGLMAYQRESSGSAVPTPPGLIQMIDAGRKLVVTQCEGFVINELLSLLHSIHLGRRCIWITLVGQTMNDLQGVLGGDSSLSHEGLQYARAVRDHILAREASEDLALGGGHRPPPAMVLTGTLKRNVEMAEMLCADDATADALLCSEQANAPSSAAAEPAAAAPATDAANGDGAGGAAPAQRRISLQLTKLNELCAGKLDSVTYEEMRELYPSEYQARSGDKLNYRYPGAGGESYMDLIMRLESGILQLEQTRGNVVVACDRAVCRVLLGYFNGIADLEQLPYVDVHQGVIELRRSHSGFSTSHTPIRVGRTTSATGPGTARLPSP